MSTSKNPIICATCECCSTNGNKGCICSNTIKMAAAEQKSCTSSSDACCKISEESPLVEVSSIQSSCVPLPLPEDQLQQLVSDARDFALLHGAGMRYRDSYSLDSLSMAPFFLLPTPFPRRDFDRVYELQPLINKLVHGVAHNHDFLEKCMRNTIKVDEFTRRLWELYMTVREEGVRQSLSLGLLRSDVMLTECTPGCCSVCFLPPYVMNQQVEINTIASGFGHMGPVSARIQKYVLSIMDRQDLIANLPPNPALQELCGGMIAAWDAYSREKACIMFIVEAVAYNICDQRFHEYEIMRQRPGLRVLRRTLAQVHDNGTIDDEYRLWVDSYEVAVVYYRYGYDPSCYPGEEEWTARLTIERSLAIKCPSMHYHLAGTKKVQQELAVKGALSQFLTPDEAVRVSELFTGLYTLDMGPEGDRTVAMALEDPHRYVLKPQREGGGNNVYGEDIRTTLQRVGHTPAREAFILMQRIRAPVQRNYLVRPGRPVELANIVSELGIFGAVLGTSTEIILNKTCGHMLRSKLSNNNEGGVASGNGALDSVLLVD